MRPWGCLQMVARLSTKFSMGQGFCGTYNPVDVPGSGLVSSFGTSFTNQGGVRFFTEFG